MKTNSLNLFAALSNISVRNLTMEVKEKLAVENKPESRKSFGAVDLWKIQRNSRTAMVRRNFSLA